MNIGMKDLAEIISVLKVSTPIAEELVNNLQMYGPPLKKLLSGVSDFVVEESARMFKRYVDEFYFSREEALMLVLNSKRALRESLDRSSKKK